MTPIFFLQISRSIPSLVLDAGIFAKLILLVLFGLSFVSWVIMVERFLHFRKMTEQDRRVKGAGNGGGSPDSWSKLAASNPASPLAAMAHAGHRLLSEVGKRLHLRRVGDIAGLSEEDKRTLIEMLSNALERRRAEEVSRLEKNLIFLATTASVSPFLGLLGTVWGIMGSFVSMGVEGSASLNVVAPGIAEALITTVAGLASAIPALVGYNLLVRRIRREEADMERFGLEMLQAVEGATLDLPSPRPAPRRVVDQESLTTGGSS
jgi:biopolymer transport protein TolQ